MTSQSLSRTLPGTSQEGEIDPLFAPRAFQGRQDEFLGRPGPCQSLSGTAPGRVWKQGYFDGLSKHFGLHFRSPGASFWNVCGNVFSTCLLPLFLFFLLRATHQPRSHKAKRKAQHKQRTRNSTAKPGHTRRPGLCKRWPASVAALQRV